MTSRFRLLAALLIGGFVLFIFWDSYHQRWDQPRRFQQWFGVSLPAGTQFFRNEEPNPFNVFQSRIYSYFWLPPEEMTRFIAKPPDGYSRWRCEFETFDGDHFFTSGQWPQAQFCNRSTPRTEQVFIADPPSGMVYGMAWNY